MKLKYALLALLLSSAAFATSTSTDVIDSVSTSTAIKAPVLCVTPSNVTLSGLQTITSDEGSFVLVDGDRVAAANQTTAADNGIYVAHSTAWTRAVDMDGARDVRNGTLFTTVGGQIWKISGTDPIVIGTSSLTFSETSALFTLPAAGSRINTVFTFNGSGNPSMATTLPATNFPVLTGDVTTPGSSLAATLANSGVSAGSYGSGSLVPVITVDAKGRVTSASTSAIVSAGATITARAASIGSNVTTAGGAPTTLDGVTLAANDVVLLKNQGSSVNNGLYKITTLGTGANGTWARTTDTLAAAQLVSVSEGNINQNSAWMLTTANPITVGVSSIVYTPVSVRYLGSANVAAGDGAMSSAPGGSNNTAFGANALKLGGSLNNTVMGGGAMDTGTGGNNTVIGTNAYRASSGGNNTAVGSNAMNASTSGDHNSAFGMNALQGVGANDDVGVGYFAGSVITTGTQNTFIGTNADSTANNRTNATAIGYSASATADNSVFLGNGSVTAIYRGTTANRLAELAANQSFTKAQAVTPVTLTDAASITVDATLGNVFKVTLGGNRTLANPTGMLNGQSLTFQVKQDGTGTRTLAYDTKYKWPGGTAPTLTTAASSIDVLSCYYESVEDKLLCVANKDFK